FASYGFNKSHAAAYALVSYQTAWLKTHYPAEFMAAVLSSDMDSTDKVVAFLHECRALQLAVLPPDVNASRHDFVAIDAKTLRYGLGAIKGVGAGVCHEIAALRDRDGPYASFFDFCERLGPKVNRRVHETLIASGALDSLGSNRASMKAQLPDIARVVEQRARDREAGQVDLFGASPAAQAQTLPELASLPELPLMERLKAEREVLGHYLSGHPLDGLREYLANVLACTLDGVEACREQRRMARGDDGNVLLAGQVVAINRRNESRIFFAMEDGCGRVEVTAFSDALDDVESWLSNDALLVVEGYLQEDRFNGGTSLRLRRAWHVDEFIRIQARRITFSLDAKAPDSVPRLLAALAPWRGGHASLSIAVHTAQARGIVDGGDSLKLHGKVELIEQLRALPTVSGVRMKLAAPTPLPPRARSGRD
ncbi:MAG: DNA polymerase III subunit alpha, partial [Xanthomonadales bacterium]|nr:DNA polymerase III subunit alpha [Xanthomonadales bacterium]